MIRKKVLWCDRNIFVYSFHEMLEALKGLEIVSCSTIADAKKKMEETSFSLIICGNVFNHGESGLHFFESLNLVGTQSQFLLLSGDFIPEDHPFLILENFTYLRKESLTFPMFQMLIEELLNKSNNTEDIHVRLKFLRLHLKLSAAEFGTIIGCTSEMILKYEEDKDVPAHHIVKVCKKFSIPVSSFCSVEFKLFQERLTGIIINLPSKAQA